MLLRHNTARALFIALGSLVTLCMLGSLIALAQLPGPIRTHSDAVAYALQQRSIAYNRIRLASTLAAIPGYNHFPGERHPFTVQIALTDGSVGKGMLDCDSNDNECLLTVASLNLSRVSVPNRATERIWPLWDALDSVIQNMARFFVNDR